MKYRRLGRTELHVSEIALGTVELGLDYGIPVDGMQKAPSSAEASRLLNHALDQGINLIDTAPAYGDSESIIGRALKSRRKDYILATKVGPLPATGLTGKALQQEVKASVIASLRALQTDVIDLLQIHSATVDVIRNGDMLTILRDMQRAGHVRFVGVTTYGEAAALMALKDKHYDCVQIAYNLLDRQLEERVLPLAQQQDIGVLVRSVLLKGALTHRHTHLPREMNELKVAVQQLHEMAGQEDLSVPEAAYRFVLSHQGVGAALVGTARLTELEAALMYACHGPLPSTLLAGIDRVVINNQDCLNPTTWSIQ